MLHLILLILAPSFAIISVVGRIAASSNARLLIAAGPVSATVAPIEWIVGAVAVSPVGSGAITAANIVAKPIRVIGGGTSAIAAGVRVIWVVGSISAAISTVVSAGTAVPMIAGGRVHRTQQSKKD